MSRLVDTNTDAFNFKPKDAAVDIKRKATFAELERWLKLDSKSKIDAIQNFKIVAGPEWYEYMRKRQISSTSADLVRTEDSVLIAAFLASK